MDRSRVFSIIIIYITSLVYGSLDCRCDNYSGALASQNPPLIFTRGRLNSPFSPFTTLLIDSTIAACLSTRVIRRLLTLKGDPPANILNATGVEGCLHSSVTHFSKQLSNCCAKNRILHTHCSGKRCERAVCRGSGIQRRKQLHVKGENNLN
jgi:hypothetical protein